MINKKFITFEISRTIKDIKDEINSLNLKIEKEMEKPQNQIDYILLCRCDKRINDLKWIVYLKKNSKSIK